MHLCSKSFLGPALVPPQTHRSSINCESDHDVVRPHHPRLLRITTLQVGRLEPLNEKTTKSHRICKRRESLNGELETHYKTSYTNFTDCLHPEKRY